jgi:hypothetical protein
VISNTASSIGKTRERAAPGALFCAGVEPSRRPLALLRLLP